MADKRGESGGRRLPLPAPDVDETGRRVRVSGSRLPVGRAPQEVPRLPESMFEESSEIDLDDVDGMTPPPQPPPRPITSRLPLQPTGRKTPAPPQGRHHERPTQPGERRSDEPAAHERPALIAGSEAEELAQRLK